MRSLVWRLKRVLTRRVDCKVRPRFPYAEGLPGARSGRWEPSTIHGNGTLNSGLYIGKLVWNRQRFLKDPDTGKRIARPNPEDEWIVQEMLALRILDDDL